MRSSRASWCRRYEKVTVFRPDELSRERSRLRAEVYNHCRLLLRRRHGDRHLVPTRSMQYQGIVIRDEGIFVDAQGYAVQDREGGRTVVSAWQFLRQQSRESLDGPVAVDFVHCHPDSAARNGHLPVEFDKAMQALL